MKGRKLRGLRGRKSFKEIENIKGKEMRISRYAAVDRKGSKIVFKVNFFAIPKILACKAISYYFKTI